MEKKGKQYYRWEMVICALQYGISKAAKTYNTTRKTVRKWVNRFKEGDYDNLVNKSRKDQFQPNKMPQNIEKKIIEVRTKYPFWGARRIKEHLELNYSQVTINKKLKQAGLIKKKKKKYRQRKEKAEYMKKIRNQFKVLEKIQIDIKYLTDIFELLFGIKFNGIPKYQITARDYKSGIQIIGYCNEKSSTATAIFIDYVCQKLEKAGVDVSKITFQTDNGTEFVSNSKNKLSLFQKIIIEKYHAKHKRIPPGKPTYNSDVETVHNLIENEFYKVETFESKEDFLKKVYAYLIYFNNFRKNRNRDNKTPKDIFIMEGKKDLIKKLNIKPIIVDDYIKDIQKINQPGYFNRLLLTPQFVIDIKPPYLKFSEKIQ